MTITNNFVQVPAQSKSLDTSTVTTGAGLVHRQAVSISDPESPTGYAKITGDALNVVLAKGQTNKAGSVSVTIASDQGTIPVSMTLPTGAATEVTLDSINTKLGQLVGAVSVGNTTTTPLNSGVTFTGTGEQNQYRDVYVSCITSHTGKLYFDFSNDGTNWNVFPPNGFDLAANVHEAHKALKAGRYFRVRVTNTSGSNQTYLRLYTYYGEFDQLTSPLNFAPNLDSDATTTKSILVGQTDGGVFNFVGVTPQGELEVSIKDPTSIFGEVITAELTPVIQSDFVYGLNANLVSSSITGSGTATSSGQMGVASTTAAINSSALIQTVRRAKYRAGEGILSRFTAQFTTGVANSTQTAGMRNAAIDGWFIGYNGTQFGIMYRRNSVDTWIAQSSFNLDKLDGTGASGITIDPTKLNAYQLSVGYLGGRGCIFSVMSDITGQWVKFHDYNLLDTQDAQTQSVNPTMSFGIQATNTTNTTNIVVRSGSVGVFIAGEIRRIGSTYGTNNTKSIATTETSVLTLRNNTTINGVTNQGLLRLRSISISTAATVPVILRVVKNATLGGVPAYTNIDATNSIAAFDVAGTTVTGGNTQFNSTIGTGGNAFFDLTDFELFLLPNETFTFAVVASAGAAANQVVTVNWNEDI